MKEHKYIEIFDDYTYIYIPKDKLSEYTKKMKKEDWHIVRNDGLTDTNKYKCFIGHKIKIYEA